MKGPDATCPNCLGLMQEIIALRALVEFAYKEGGEDAGRGYFGDGYGADWDKSESKKALDEIP